MKKILLTVVVMLLLAVGGGAAYIYGGLFNPATTTSHSALVYWVLATTSRRAIDVRAEQYQPPPDLTRPDRVAEGLRLYRDACQQCHGAPGIAPAAFATGMAPVPPNLMRVAREWKPEQIFWTIKHGIKMSGMPGWEFRMTEDEMWDTTAFVKRMAALSPAEYADLAEAAGAPVAEAMIGDGDAQPASAADAPPDPQRGRIALMQYGCTACHSIEGVVSRDIRIGPPLRNMAEQKFIAGVLPNTRENLARWIASPHEVDPLNAMPPMGVGRRDARDIAAYLLDPG